MTQNNLPPANSCLRVIKSFPLLVKIGHTDRSNTFVGRTMALHTVYFDAEAQPGAHVLHLHGGIFYVPPGAEVMYDARYSREFPSLFEHGGACEFWPVECLEKVEWDRGSTPRFTDITVDLDRHKDLGVCGWVSRAPALVYSTFDRPLPGVYTPVKSKRSGNARLVTRDKR